MQLNILSKAPKKAPKFGRTMKISHTREGEGTIFLFCPSRQISWAWIISSSLHLRQIEETSLARKIKINLPVSPGGKESQALQLFQQQQPQPTSIANIWNLSVMLKWSTYNLEFDKLQFNSGVIAFWQSYLVEVCVRQDRKLFLDRLQEPDGDIQSVVCFMSKLRRVPDCPKGTSRLRLHIEGTSGVPSTTEMNTEPEINNH